MKPLTHRSHNMRARSCLRINDQTEMGDLLRSPARIIVTGAWYTSSAWRLPTPKSLGSTKMTKEGEDLMKRVRGIIAFVSVLGLLPAGANLQAQQPSPFSSNHMESVLYGVAYYPEYMPTDRLDRDVELMQKAGITVVRVGESTWSSWEPREGDFQFDWMQRGLDRM